MLRLRLMAKLSLKSKFKTLAAPPTMFFSLQVNKFLCMIPIESGEVIVGNVSSEKKISQLKVEELEA
jgi:hypothetical protein